MFSEEGRRCRGPAVRGLRRSQACGPVSGWAPAVLASKTEEEVAGHTAEEVSQEREDPPNQRAMAEGTALGAHTGCRPQKWRCGGTGWGQAWAESSELRWAEPRGKSTSKPDPGFSRQPPRWLPTPPPPGGHTCLPGRVWGPDRTCRRDGLGLEPLTKDAGFCSALSPGSLAVPAALPRAPGGRPSPGRELGAAPVPQPHLSVHSGKALSHNHGPSCAWVSDPETVR